MHPIKTLEKFDWEEIRQLIYLDIMEIEGEIPLVYEYLVKKLQTEGLVTRGKIIKKTPPLYSELIKLGFSWEPEIENFIEIKITERGRMILDNHPALSALLWL